MKGQAKKLSFDSELSRTRMEQIEEICRRGDVRSHDIAQEMGMTWVRIKQFLTHMERMGWLSVKTASNANLYTSTGKLEEIKTVRRVHGMDRDILAAHMRKPMAPAHRDWAVAALFGKAA